MTAFIYWIFFPAALVWGPRTAYIGNFLPSGDDYIDQAIQMALLAVGCIWAGMRLPLKTPALKGVPDIDELAPSSWVYVRMVLICSTLISLFPSLYWLGSGGRNIMAIAGTVVPTAAYLLLLRKYWLKRAVRADRLLLIGIGAIRVVGGLASGWLGSIASFGLMLLAFYVLIHRTIPWIPILATVAITFFLQVGKEEFRATYWTGEQTSTVLERAKFWLNTSVSRWEDAFQGSSTAQPTDLAARTFERASLLSQVAHVLELTPTQVPFQRGQTYSYLVVALIPRFLWHDKPSVSEANQFYQVAYGLTDARDVDTTSIAIGSMGESYINFGWPGVLLIMTAIGVLLRTYAGLCTSKQPNSLVLVVAIAVLPQLLTIESQLGQYVSGLMQDFALTLVIFLPVTRRKTQRRHAAFSSFPSPHYFRNTGEAH